jgi:hypothetical protein
MQSSTMFADEMTQRHESGQLEAAVKKVLHRLLRAGSGEESGLKKLIFERLQQIKEAGLWSASATEQELLSGISRRVSDRLASPAGQAELRCERRRKAETLNFGSTRVTGLLESLDLGRRFNPGSQPTA